MPDGLAAVRYYKEVAGREVLVVVPDHHEVALPLVLALHGCSQTAGEFATATGLADAADREGFVLVVPETQVAADNPLGCWRWWQPDQQRRDGAEPRLLAEAVQSVDVQIDPGRVYALGFSSGGAMAAILAVVYADLFAAVGIHSGIGFAAAANVPCALDVMEDGPGRDTERGTLGYLHQSVPRVVPVLILQGDGDTVVSPDHAKALVRETAQRNDRIDDGEDNDSFDHQPDAALDDPARCVDKGCYPHRLSRFEDDQGEPMLESILVEGLGHRWSGGADRHDYTDPDGPDAGVLFWRFFERHRLDPDSLQAAEPRHCRDRWAAPWWHLTWGGMMSFAEHTCNMSPWRTVWRHEIEGIHGPGRCP